MELVREFLAAFVLGGGERLRPLFVYWGYRAVGGDRLETVLPRPAPWSWCTWRRCCWTT